MHGLDVVGQDLLAAECDLAEMTADVAVLAPDVAHQPELQGEASVALLAAVTLDSAMNLLLVNLQPHGTAERLATLLTVDGSLFGTMD